MPPRVNLKKRRLPSKSAGPPDEWPRSEFHSDANSLLSAKALLFFLEFYGLEFDVGRVKRNQHKEDDASESYGLLRSKMEEVFARPPRCNGRCSHSPSVLPEKEPKFILPVPKPKFLFAVDTKMMPLVPLFRLGFRRQALRTVGGQEFKEINLSLAIRALFNHFGISIIGFPRLTGRPVHSPAGEEVEMKMKYGLTGLGTGIENESVAFEA